jgi:hypothetical protein
MILLPPLWLKMALWKATEKETNQACTHTHTHKPADCKSRAREKERREKCERGYNGHEAH